jgi:hypothetical protein
MKCDIPIKQKKQNRWKHQNIGISFIDFLLNATGTLPDMQHYL